MSWQSYVDDHLLGSGRIARVVVLGLQGGVWACSKDYELSTEEQRAVIDAYNDPSHVMSSGLKLAGTKFFCLSANERSIQLKKRADGAVLVKTKQAILVAEYAAPVQGPEATTVVERLADYLISLGIIHNLKHYVVIGPDLVDTFILCSAGDGPWWPDIEDSYARVETSI